MSEDTSAPVDFGIAAEYPWPRGDHTLSARGADWRSAAYFYSGIDDEHARIEGFRQAASLIFERMLASSAERNLLVYPFVYNWRHAVELQLKDLIRLFARLEQIPVEDAFLNSHNLAKLWSKLRPSVDELIGELVVRKVEVDAATRIIGQLTAIDPDGQELRYHVRTDGKPSLTTQKLIDPPKFHEAMQGASAFLDGLTTCAFQELEHRREMLEEFGP